MSAVMVSPSRNASSAQAGAGDQRKQWEPGVQFHAHERAFRDEGRQNAGGQTIAHAAGDGGVALENHVLTADANKHFARRGWRRERGECDRD